MTPSRLTRAIVVMASVLTAAVLGGCSAGSAGEQPRLLVASTDGSQICRQHQSAAPGSDYAGGTDADTAKVFTLLKYWKEAGDAPFCDGRPATDADRAWAELVEDLLDRQGQPSSAPTTT